MRFCTDCGTPVGGSPRYCAGCGAEVDPAWAAGLSLLNSRRMWPSTSPLAEPASAARPGPPSPAAGSGPWTSLATAVDPWAADSPAGDREPWAADGFAGSPEPWATGGLAGDPEPWATDGLARTAEPWATAALADDPDPWAAASPASAAAAFPEPGRPGSPASAAYPQAGGRAGADASVADRLRTAPAYLRHLAAEAPAYLRRLASGGRMTILAMVTAAGLLVIAGVAIYQISQVISRRAPASAGHPAAGGGMPRGSRTGTTPIAGSGQPSSGHPAPAPSARPSPTRTPTPTAQPSQLRPAVTPTATVPPPAGQGTVAVSPAVAESPLAAPVVAFLATYFEAINTQNFPLYASLFVPSIRATMQNFGTGYTTTSDSGAIVTGLVFTDTDQDDLAVTVTFISHQSPAASPDHAACDVWDITLFLKLHQGTILIGHAKPGFPQSVRACY
jgi:hypothetical protein